MAIDRFAAYEETRAHLRSFVLELSTDELATTVPACPAWTVQDVLAHVVSEARIAATGDAPPELNLLEAWRDQGQARMRDDMNAREVAARRGRSVDELLDEWDGIAATLGPMLRGERTFPWDYPFVDSIVVMDAALHDQDIRNALRRPGNRETNAIRLGLSAYVAGLDLRLKALGIAPLRLRYGDRDRVVGGDEPAAALTADRYELYRALASRRTADQIRAMGWDGDPEPYVPVIPTYGERDPAIDD